MDAISAAVSLYHDERERVASGQEACTRMVLEHGSEYAIFCLKMQRQAESNLSERIQSAITYNQAMAQEELHPAQLAVVGKGITLWVVPSIGLYLLGMGISWTKRGFLKPS